MKLCAVFPTTEIGNDPAAIRDWAQAAEELGYASIIAYDHVLGASHANRTPRLTGPYTEAHAFHEPFVLLAYLAGVTRTVELATGVLILPQRQTALVAKQAAELQVLSQGRLRLGSERAGTASSTRRWVFRSKAAARATTSSSTCSSASGAKSSWTSAAPIIASIAPASCRSRRRPSPCGSARSRRWP